MVASLLHISTHQAGIAADIAKTGIAASTEIR